MTISNPLFDNTDIALVQHSARDELNRTHVTIQNPNPLHGNEGFV